MDELFPLSFERADFEDSAMKMFEGLCSRIDGSPATVPVKKEPSWRDAKVLQRLRVSPEFLVPLCSTLQHLQLGKMGWKFDFFFGEYYNAPLGFVLRHLPLLKKLDLPASMSNPIKILYETKGLEHTATAEDVAFQEACQKALGKLGIPERNGIDLPKFSGGLISFKYYFYYS